MDHDVGAFDEVPEDPEATQPRMRTWVVTKHTAGDRKLERVVGPAAPVRRRSGTLIAIGLGLVGTAGVMGTGVIGLVAYALWSETVARAPGHVPQVDAPPARVAIAADPRSATSEPSTGSAPPRARESAPEARGGDARPVTSSSTGSGPASGGDGAAPAPVVGAAAPIAPSADARGAAPAVGRAPATGGPVGATDENDGWVDAVVSWVTATPSVPPGVAIVPAQARAARGSAPAGLEEEAPVPSRVVARGRDGGFDPIPPAAPLAARSTSPTAAPSAGAPPPGRTAEGPTVRGSDGAWSSGDADGSWLETVTSWVTATPTPPVVYVEAPPAVARPSEAPAGARRDDPPPPAGLLAGNEDDGLPTLAVPTTPPTGADPTVAAMLAELDAPSAAPPGVVGARPAPGDDAVADAGLPAGPGVAASEAAMPAALDGGPAAPSGTGAWLDTVTAWITATPIPEVPTGVAAPERPRSRGQGLEPTAPAIPLRRDGLLPLAVEPPLAARDAPGPTGTDLPGAPTAAAAGGAQDAPVRSPVAQASEGEWSAVEAQGGSWLDTVASWVTTAPQVPAPVPGTVARAPGGGLDPIPSPGRPVDLLAGDDADLPTLGAARPTPSGADPTVAAMLAELDAPAGPATGAAPREAAGAAAPGHGAGAPSDAGWLDTVAAWVTGEAVPEPGLAPVGPSSGEPSPAGGFARDAWSAPLGATPSSLSGSDPVAAPVVAVVDHPVGASGLGPPPAAAPGARPVAAPIVSPPTPSASLVVQSSDGAWSAGPDGDGSWLDTVTSWVTATPPVTAVPLASTTVLGGRGPAGGGGGGGGEALLVLDDGLSDLPPERRGPVLDPNDPALALLASLDAPGTGSARPASPALSREGPSPAQRAGIAAPPSASWLDTVTTWVFGATEDPMPPMPATIPGPVVASVAPPPSAPSVRPSTPRRTAPPPTRVQDPGRVVSSHGEWSLPATATDGSWLASIASLAAVVTGSEGTAEPLPLSATPTGAFGAGARVRVSSSEGTPGVDLLAGDDGLVDLGGRRPSAPGQIDPAVLAMLAEIGELPPGVDPAMLAAYVAAQGTAGTPCVEGELCDADLRDWRDVGDAGGLTADELLFLQGVEQRSVADLFYVPGAEASGHGELEGLRTIVVRITSEPPGVPIVVDGRPIGESPTMAEVVPGRHLVGFYDSAGTEEVYAWTDPDQWCFAGSGRQLRQVRCP